MLKFYMLFGFETALNESALQPFVDKCKNLQEFQVIVLDLNYENKEAFESIMQLVSQIIYISADSLQVLTLAPICSQQVPEEVQAFIEEHLAFDRDSLTGLYLNGNKFDDC